jgi:hypothetical protein
VSLRFIALVIVNEAAAWAVRRARRLASTIRAFIECTPDSPPQAKRRPGPRNLD